MGSKLTKAQATRLREISDYRGTPQWPNSGYCQASSTDRSLLKRGLIERADMPRTLVGGLSATWHGCKLTESGRAALAEASRDA